MRKLVLGISIAAIAAGFSVQALGAITWINRSIPHFSVKFNGVPATDYKADFAFYKGSTDGHNQQHLTTTVYGAQLNSFLSSPVFPHSVGKNQEFELQTFTVRTQNGYSCDVVSHLGGNGIFHKNASQITVTINKAGPCSVAIA